MNILVKVLAVSCALAAIAFSHLTSAERMVVGEMFTNVG